MKIFRFPFAGGPLGVPAARILTSVMLLAGIYISSAQPDSPVIGRWDLTVSMDGRELPRDHSQVADRFGGVPAPLLQLTIKQDRCELLQTIDA